MHSNVTIKNVSWPHFSWPTLYMCVQSSGDLRRADVWNAQVDCQEFRATRLGWHQRRHGRYKQVRTVKPGSKDPKWSHMTSVKPQNNVSNWQTTFGVDGVPCLNKNCATIYSFISLTNVDRFSQFFHSRIFHEICNTTLQNTEDREETVFGLGATFAKFWEKNIAYNA